MQVSGKAGMKSREEDSMKARLEAGPGREASSRGRPRAGPMFFAPALAGSSAAISDLCAAP